jgi:phospholipid/cholesterol/gamma-HCH transport system substrate-binding protein
METRSNNVLVGTVVLIMALALAGFFVWLANDSGGKRQEYDIFFKQAVDGLNKGSQVTYSGVGVGEVVDIALWPDDPDFIRVRIEVDTEAPVRQGTTAQLSGVGFTGVTQVALDGAVKGAPLITDAGPAGRPVIPTRVGGLGELLNTAPQLLERLTTLTERLTEIANDKNQQSLANTLANIESTTAMLARSGPAIEAALLETRTAVQNAGVAAERVGLLAQSTQSTIERNIDPAMADLRKALRSADGSMAQLTRALGAAEPGLESFSQTTVPQANALIRDLRQTSAALTAFTEKLDQQGAGALVGGGGSLPDYKGGN